MDVRSDPPSPRVISCDDCAMQCTSRCDDCVVTYFVRRDGVHDEEPEPLSLDRGEERVVRLLSKAGLIPELRHSLVG